MKFYTKLVILGVEKLAKPKTSVFALIVPKLPSFEVHIPNFADPPPKLHTKCEVFAAPLTQYVICGSTGWTINQCHCGYLVSLPFHVKNKYENS